MRADVKNSDVGFAQHSRNGAKCAAKPAVKKHRVLAPEKLRDTSFEFPVQIGHSGEHRRTAGAQSVCSERFARSDEHLGMIGEAEIIVGTKINYGTRFAAVGDHRVRVGSGEELRLV